MTEHSVPECPNCGAPLDLGSTGCAYCRVTVVEISIQSDGREAPAARSPKGDRAGKLAAFFGAGTIGRLWTDGSQAWGRKREVGYDELAGDDRDLCDVVLATMGVALVASRSLDKGALPAALSRVSGGRFDEEAARDVLTECQRYLDEEGLEDAFESAAEILDDAELLEDCYQLIAGLALLNGALSDSDGKVLDDIARAFDLPTKHAQQLRQAVAVAMA